MFALWTSLTYILILLVINMKGIEMWDTPTAVKLMLLLEVYIWLVLWDVPGRTSIKFGTIQRAVEWSVPILQWVKGGSDFYWDVHDFVHDQDVQRLTDKLAPVVGCGLSVDEQLLAFRGTAHLDNSYH